MEHASRSDCWIVIRGAVLNITGFVGVHPGGPIIVEGSKEVDAAGLFAQHHQPSTVALMSNFCIGRLEPN
jgi:L-lactate dehydrogenase (cytochrome)